MSDTVFDLEKALALADEAINTPTTERVYGGRQLATTLRAACVAYESKHKENSRLREALSDAQGKAELAVKVLRAEGQDRHLNKIADGFQVIANHCAAALKQGE